MNEAKAPYRTRRGGTLKDGSISEKAFAAQVVRFAKLNNWMVYFTYRSTHSPSGFPDLCFVMPKERITPIYPDGVRMIFAELKSRSGKVTEQQEDWMAAINLAGVPCYIWRPTDSWKEIEEVLGNG